MIGLAFHRMIRHCSRGPADDTNSVCSCPAHKQNRKQIRWWFIRMLAAFGSHTPAMAWLTVFHFWSLERSVWWPEVRLNHKPNGTLETGSASRRTFLFIAMIWSAILPLQKVHFFTWMKHNRKNIYSCDHIKFYSTVTINQTKEKFSSSWLL